MRFWGILRASALCLLVSAFHGPGGVFCSNLEVNPSAESFTVEVSEDHEDSTVESQESLPSSQSNLVFQRPSWHDSHLASAVFFLEEFCQEVRADAFSGRLVDELYEGMKEPCLRVSYYARSYTDHFRPRNLLDGPYKDALKPEMFQHYVEWLVENIPGITGSLELMFNKVTRLSEKILKNDASVAPTIYGFEFHDVWTDKDFMSSLRHKTSNLVNALKYLHGSLGKFSSDSFRNPLTEAQSNLVFENSTWDDSHLASSVLFLEEFCKDVISKKFDGKLSEAEYDDISRVCKDLSLNFKNFVEFFSPTHGHEALTEGKELCTSYKGVLNPEEFRVYAKWLVDNIPEVIKSMINMHNDSLKYSKVFLTDKLAGSLKYGFVFKGGWWRHFTSMDKFRCIVEDYLAAMESLLASLNKVLEHSAQEPTKSFNNIYADSLAQSDLVFENFSWHDSMLASAALFLQEFCKELKAEKFNGKLSEDKSEDLLGACDYVSSYLEFFIWPLVPTYGPGSVTERKEIDMDFYKNVLKPEDFDVYAKWIVKNTFKIRDSLIGMLLESLDMSETQLKTETSVGPLKYGFVFHCDGHHDKVKFAFKHATKRLTLSLQLLQNCLGEKPTEVKIEKVLRQLEGKRKAKHEKLMKEIAEQRTELVEWLSKPDTPYSLKDMEPFLGVL
ncbi:secreted antigen 1 [Babesia divergens]|uniref:Secreted antigen 1 n=1 Tax=Babesia divergens TaxID=32595 RepID=A0AAD9GDU1_BABDI|nr:secreted antigen 1 [Babesia divergens]